MLTNPESQSQPAKPSHVPLSADTDAMQEFEYEELVRKFLSTLGLRKSRLRHTLTRLRKFYGTFERAHANLLRLQRTPGWSLKTIERALRSASLLFSRPTEDILARHRDLQAYYGIDPEKAATLCTTSRAVFMSFPEIDAILASILGAKATPEQKASYILTSHKKIYAARPRPVQTSSANHDPDIAVSEELIYALPIENDAPDPSNVLEAFLQAEWTEACALEHLRAFPYLETTDPIALYRALRLFNLRLGWRDADFTRSIKEGVEALDTYLRAPAFPGLTHVSGRSGKKAPPDPEREERIRSYIISIHEIATWEKSDGGSPIEAIDWLAKRRINAQGVIKAQPGLLIDHCRPLHIAIQLAETFHLPEEIIELNLREHPRLLFEDPASIGARINKRHALLSEHSPTQGVAFNHRDTLSPIPEWDRCFFPEKSLIERLHILKKEYRLTPAPEENPKHPHYGYIARTVYAPSEKTFRALLRGIQKKRAGDEFEHPDMLDDDEG